MVGYVLGAIALRYHLQVLSTWIFLPKQEVRTLSISLIFGSPE